MLRSILILGFYITQNLFECKKKLGNYLLVLNFLKCYLSTKFNSVKKQQQH